MVKNSCSCIKFTNYMIMTTFCKITPHFTLDNLIVQQPTAIWVLITSTSNNAVIEIKHLGVIISKEWMNDVTLSITYQVRITTNNNRKWRTQNTSKKRNTAESTDNGAKRERNETDMRSERNGEEERMRDEPDSVTQTQNQFCVVLVAKLEIVQMRILGLRDCVSLWLWW